jgi:hypothetical protein
MRKPTVSRRIVLRKFINVSCGDTLSFLGECGVVGVERESWFPYEYRLIWFYNFVTSFKLTHDSDIVGRTLNAWYEV